MCHTECVSIFMIHVNTKYHKTRFSKLIIFIKEKHDYRFSAASIMLF